MASQGRTDRRLSGPTLTSDRDSHVCRCNSSPSRTYRRRNTLRTRCTSGGTRQAFFGWGRFARTVLVVVEPTPASLLSARRLARLALHSSAPRVVAVANKTGCAADVDLIARRTGLPVVGNIPFDPVQRDADRRGLALLDLDSSTPMVSAVAALALSLTEREAVR